MLVKVMISQVKRQNVVEAILTATQQMATLSISHT